MECNKDEAMRAKSIAESRLDRKDFAGAIRFASKAQALYPGLDGISQMLTTIDVHVSAKNKINGHVDWYGVLRVDPAADDETITKRFRKLALILHPDKNKSAGAGGAFSLVSEAKSLLLDKDKRTAYDLITGREEGLKRKGPLAHTGPGAGPWIHPDDPPAYANRRVHKSEMRARAGGPPAYATSPQARADGSAAPPAESQHWTQRAPEPKKKSAEASPCGRVRAPQRAATFWTVCHHCSMQFEYLKIYCNNILLCPNCIKTFMSLEIPRPIGKSRSHKPTPWPPHYHNSVYSYPRTPTANGQGKKAPGARKSGKPEMGPSSFPHASYERGPPFGEPSEEAYATYYAGPDGMEGLFKRRRFDDYGGLHESNNYNAPHRDDHFGNASSFGSGSYEFTSRCNV